MSEPEQDRTADDARRLTGRRWRGVAIAAVAAAIGVAAIGGLSRPTSDVSRYAIVEGRPLPPARPSDPLVAELVRCRTLPANVEDAGCRTAWEVNRRRFLGESRSLDRQQASSGNPSSVATPPGNSLSKEER